MRNPSVIAHWSAVEQRWWIFLAPKGTERGSLNFYGARLWVSEPPRGLKAWALRKVFGIETRYGTAPTYL